MAEMRKPLSPKTENARTPRKPESGPRWGKRLLGNLRAAAVAAAIACTPALSGCASVKVSVVPEPSPIRNPVYDPLIGTIYWRPDGMDSILSKPTNQGQNPITSEIENTIPIPILSLLYYAEYGIPLSGF